MSKANTTNNAGMPTVAQQSKIDAAKAGKEPVMDFKSAQLIGLGEKLAGLDNQAEGIQASQMALIFECAKGHKPLNGADMSREAKKAFKADISAGYKAARPAVSDTTLEITVSYFFRGLVYATNGILPGFKGKPQAYCLACETEPKASEVWAKQVKKDRAPKVGGAAKKDTAPEVYTAPQMIAELLRFAGMLGWTKEIQAVVDKKTAKGKIAEIAPQRKAA